MKKFSNILRGLRCESDLTQQELAEKLGISFSSISMYERGQREPNFETLELIADYFNVDMNYLLGKSNIKNSYKIIESEDSDTDAELCRPYPIIGEVAAGYGSEAIEEETGDYERIPIEWLRGHNPDNFFVLRVKGDSMYPDFQDGDCVLVHRQTSVDSGTVAVMLYDSEIATLKKVRYKKNESWVELIPRNPEYQTKRIENWDLNECRVLGEVRRLIRVVK